jgi:hypothetical protein
MRHRTAPPPRPDAPGRRARQGRGRRAGAAAAILLLGVTGVAGMTGCATVGRSPVQRVLVASEPAGADVLLDGAHAGTTPVILPLRRRDPGTIVLHSAGYLPDTIALARSPSYGWLAGNLLLYHPAIGVGGIAVDLATGAHRTIRPAASATRLTPDAGPEPARRAAPHYAWLPVPLGSRIRVATVSAPGLRTGALLDVSGDTLLVDAGAAELLRAPRRELTRLEVGSGQDRVSSALRYGGMGTVPGCVAAYGWQQLTAQQHKDLNAAMACMVVGVPAGALAGAAFGALRPAQRWLRVE